MVGSRISQIRRSGSQWTNLRTDAAAQASYPIEDQALQQPSRATPR